MTKTKWYRKPIYLMVTLALVLALGIVSMPGTVGAATLYEHYNTDDESTFWLYAQDWRAQTFTAESTHSVTSVRLKLRREGSPGEVTVSIRATDGSGHPTGADLTSGTTDGNTLPTGASWEWREITLTPYFLTSGTKYAIVVRAPNGTSGNELRWRGDGSSPTYAGGEYGVSDDSGTTWAFYSIVDFMFEVWSEPPTEVWVDDSWCCQSDVDLFDPGLTWQYDAFDVIQDGVDAVAEDGTVHVRAGKYDENVVIGDKSLTLQSTDGWQETTIDPVGDSIIRIEGDVDVTVQGFEITAGSWGIYVGEIFSTVSILDCFIHDNLADGIRVVGGGDLLHIEGNIITQNGAGDTECGIHIEQAWNATIIRYNVIGGWWDGEDEGTIYAGNNGDGLCIDNVPAECNVTIWRNFIAENGDDGVDFPSVTSVHGSVNIEENAIGAWPCYYEGEGTHNFGGNENHGIHVGEISDTGSVNIEGNAISENGDDGIDFGQGAGAIFGNVDIKSNLIGGWTCYAGQAGYAGDTPQRYGGNGGEGIYIFQAGNTSVVNIEGNKISENAWVVVDTGIAIDIINGVVTIAHNDIGAWEDGQGGNYTGNVGQGIMISSVLAGAELTIGPDNRICGNSGHGIDILWAETDASIDIHHNVVDDNGPRGRLASGIKLGSGGVCGAMVRDNIITNNHKGIDLDEYSTQNTIQDNEIRDNRHGVWIEGDDNQIIRNDILNNVELPPSGVHLTSYASNNTIRCNNIVGNLPYGVYNENVEEAVNAIKNWWGDSSGPYHETLNPGGLGNAVSANVTFEPCLPMRFQDCPECGAMAAVGGEAYPVSKLGILAPWIAFGAAIMAGVAMLTRRRRAQS